MTLSCVNAATIGKSIKPQWWQSYPTSTLAFYFCIIKVSQSRYHDGSSLTRNLPRTLTLPSLDVHDKCERSCRDFWIIIAENDPAFCSFSSMMKHLHRSPAHLATPHLTNNGWKRTTWSPPSSAEPELRPNSWMLFKMWHSYDCSSPSSMLLVLCQTPQEGILTLKHPQLLHPWCFNMYSPLPNSIVACQISETIASPRLGSRRHASPRLRLPKCRRLCETHLLVRVLLPTSSHFHSFHPEGAGPMWAGAAAGGQTSVSALPVFRMCQGPARGLGACRGCTGRGAPFEGIICMCFAAWLYCCMCQVH